MLEKSYQRLKKIYAENIIAADGIKILDIGCGCRGNFAGFPAGSYHGIDNDAKLVSRLRRRADGLYTCMDAVELGFSEKHFDYIISTSFFHHLSPRQTAQAAGRINRVLKDDGRVIIADGVYPSCRSNIAGRLVRFFDRGRFVKTREDFSADWRAHFSLQKEYYFEESIFAYSVLVLKKGA